MKRKKKINLRRKPEPEAVEAPAIITPMHRQDRVLSAAAGAPKGFRRIDRLQWLADHGDIGAHQLHAGRRLQRDWQIAKIEAGPRMPGGAGGGGGGRDRCRMRRWTPASGCAAPWRCCRWSWKR